MELISTTLMAQRSENAAGGFKIRKDTKKKREIADKVNDFERILFRICKILVRLDINSRRAFEINFPIVSPPFLTQTTVKILSEKDPSLFDYSEGKPYQF